MSSTKTTNLNLNTWLDTDVVDFNEMNDNFSKLDKLGIDYIVETGTSDFWTWRKWNSGRVDLYGTSAHESISDWYAYGNAFATFKTSPAYPFNVIDPHVLSIQPIVKPNEGETGYGLYYAVSRQVDATDQQDRVGFYLASAKSDDVFNGFVRYYVTGWWK